MLLQCHVTSPGHHWPKFEVYEDIFGPKAKQLSAVQLLAKIVETRERLIDAKNSQHNADQCTTQVR